MEILPLSFLDTGKEAVVIKVLGGNGIKGKLGEIGFVQGSKIRNISNDGTGPLVVSIMGSRIALGRGMSQKILVKERC